MIVIADDITGAAEIAAIAQNRGYKARLIVYQLNESKKQIRLNTTDSECLVIATNTRSLPLNLALLTIKTLAKSILDEYKQRKVVLFKKVDSALRGHVADEIETLQRILGFKNVLYIPCNPSKGRIIKNGIYYIDEKPLNETNFSYDPEFPAYSASIRERFPNLSYKDAITTNDIQTIINNIPTNELHQTLLAGAADLFNCLCQKESIEGKQTIMPFTLKDATDIYPPYRVKILLGSTQSNEKEIDIVAGHKISFCPMPESVFEGKEDTSWATGEDVCLFYPQHRNGNPTWLTGIMARSLKQNIENDAEFASSSILIIEGGASAFAVLTTMEWDSFDVVGELAPGVVVLKYNKILVILKPGSYPWGSALSLERAL